MEIHLNRPVALLATDVDGTLVQSDKTISPASIAAIEEAMNQGLKVAIASGRAYNEMFEIFEKVPAVRYFICTNGALVMDRETDTCLYRESFDKAFAISLVKELLAYGVYVEAYMGHYVWGRALTEEQKKYFFNDHVRPLILASRTFVPDLLERMEASERGPEKIQIFFGDPSMETRILEDFKNREGFDVLQSSEGNLEFVMLHNTKGTAVAALAQQWHLEPDQVMTIGDSHNDISMLSYAGVSVAMGNADDVVHQVARYETTSNDQEGFARAVNAVLEENRRLQGILNDKIY